MSAPGLLGQAIAAFALHAVWQMPLLAGAAWIAVRVGRPRAHVAHALWVATLVCCVTAPFVSTWQGYRVARARAAVATASVSYSAEDVAGDLPMMQRDAAWSRFVHAHFNAVEGVKPFAFALSPRVARGITTVYVLLLAIACMRFGLAWRRARGLVRAASVDVPQEFVEAMQAQCEAMGCAVPKVAVSDDVAGPLLAGVLDPTLLLPATSAEELSASEVEAVLAHELSHLRRYDPLWHAVCSLLLLPVQFHPVANVVSARIRQTREMACDAEAVSWVGSSSRYAHALLCVAERMSFSPVVTPAVGLGLFDVERVHSAAVRDGWSWSKPGSATVGLELFGATGAMEERMQSMMKHDETASLGRRWVRGLAATAIVATSVAGACMIQVQPTFAAQQSALAQRQPDLAQPQGDTTHGQPLQVIVEDHAPALISGHRAQKQLRDASRKLNEAEANASTDDDRSKIATAQQVLRMAQSELAEQGAPQPMIVRVLPQMPLDRLEPIHLQFKPLDDQAFQFKFDQQKLQIVQADQLKTMRVLQKKLNTAQVQTQLQKRVADTVRVQVDAQMQDQVKQAQRIARDSVMIAKLDMPMVLAEQQTTGPARISAGVMAGQIVAKTQPVYPQSAKDAKISGSVVLHAIVDESGNVEQLAVISSPDKDLSRSAIEAVQHWTYKPYLLNGRPTAVDTTVTVNYTLAQ